MRAQLGDTFMCIRIIILARGPLRMRIPSNMLHVHTHDCSEYIILCLCTCTCRLMRRRIKVAEPPIFLIYVAYVHIREEVVDEYHYEHTAVRNVPGIRVVLDCQSPRHDLHASYSVRSSCYTGIATAYGSYRHASSCACGCRHAY